MRACCGFVVAFSAILLSSCPYVHAASQGIVFTKIVDTNTPIPEGTGDFPGFGFASIDGRDVAFNSTTGLIYEADVGIYVSRNGRLDKVVDRNSVIPGGSRDFEMFGPPVIRDGDILFYEASCLGVFLCSGEEIVILADNRTVTPPSPGYVYESHPSYDGDIVAFAEDPTAIYKIVEGRIELVANMTTVIPGRTTTFWGFGAHAPSPYDRKPVVDQGTIAFLGQGGDTTGIYAEVGDVLQTVIDSNTPVPDEPDYFRYLYLFDISGDTVIFLDLNYGIYKSNDSLIAPVVKIGDSAPCGALELGYSSTICIDGDVIAFQTFYYGVAGKKTGLFAKYNGRIVTVVEYADLLDGKEVRRVWPLSREALSGNNVAFHVSFKDGSGAIYVATLPDIVIEESFPPYDPDYGFTRDPNGGSAEVIVDPEDSENGLLRLYDPGDNYVSITKTVSLYSDADIWFRYKFNTDGKLEVILDDWICSCGSRDSILRPTVCWPRPVTIATITAPESGPGRDSFGTFSYKMFSDFALALVPVNMSMEVTFELRLSNDGDPELLLDDVLLTTTEPFIEPPPPGEFTGDGEVTMGDFAFLAQYWNQNDASADIAPLPFGDGRVNALDLVVFAEFWLEGVE